MVMSVVLKQQGKKALALRTSDASAILLELADGSDGSLTAILTVLINHFPVLRVDAVNDFGGVFEAVDGLAFPILILCIMSAGKGIFDGVHGTGGSLLLVAEFIIQNIMLVAKAVVGCTAKLGGQ